MTPISYPPESPAAVVAFEYQFRRFEVWDGKIGWDTAGGPQWSGRIDAAGTMPYNHELEWYISPRDKRLPSPFSLAGNVLNISAAVADPPVRPLIGGQHYTSGIITTFHWFNQQYGFFEMRAKLPRGRGLWPAFWLLPADGSWPPELDIMENLGSDHATVYQSLHVNRDGRMSKQSHSAELVDTVDGYHLYAVDWEPETITWYIDRKRVFQVETPADMNKPMYVIINLAVGGDWPGEPAGDTVFPANFSIDYLRVYTIGSSVTTTEENPGK